MDGCFVMFPKKTFKENMEKEIELTISETSSSLTFNECDKLDNDHPQKDRANLAVSHDMGWQKRGRSFSSNSGHAFLVGASTRKVLGFMVCMKRCNLCEQFDKKIDKEPPEHECPRNHKGSSKGMEAFAGAKLVEEVWDNCHACVAKICADEDSTTCAQMKHSISERNKRWIVE